MHDYAGDPRGGAYGVIVTVAVIVAIATNALVDATGVGLSWLIGAPSVAGAFALLFRLLDVVAWKWDWVRKLGVVSTPVIDGCYEGNLYSTYQNKSVPVRVSIDQRWTKIQIRFEVVTPDSSTSASVAAALHTEGHKDARLVYTYKNQIRPGIAESDMGDHDGTADIVITPNGEVKGRYFNARGRQGTLLLRRVERP